MSHDKICVIPPDKTVTYAHIVVDDCPQKSDPNWVHLTVGGNILNVPGDLSTTTSELKTSNILWNSVLSKKYARFACIDIKNMYLQTPLTDYKYMQILCHLVPQEFIDENGLERKIIKGFYIVRYKKVFMDCSNLVISQTHCYSKVLLPAGASNEYVQQACDDIFTALYNSHLSLTILV